MKYFLIVDGYNMINSWPELKTIGEDNLEDARVKLTELLENYRAYKGIKVVVVFDAHMVKGSMEKREFHGGLEVVYTKENETADAFIEKVVDEIGRKHNVLVATSDWLEQQIVLGRGAARISARELREEMLRAQKIMRDKYKIKPSAEKQSIENRIQGEVLEKLEKIRRER
ncbi:YacP-like NYN domain protein [Oxobacter pfennigii]|uniref:YacP-like NYN domain protein n=1 Tax=Oxobacter pfennigii TaxID=36849 RepID=A0A0P8WK74_9CLOT|nr:NYN domain-containing protein [Oxobacter pfennigii]KPU42650.1 YacP-like NYN domain protein [Oxobacter pfennigii]